MLASSRDFVDGGLGSAPATQEGEGGDGQDDAQKKTVSRMHFRNLVKG
jgi:hypothetical protein